MPVGKHRQCPLHFHSEASAPVLEPPKLRERAAPAPAEPAPLAAAGQLLSATAAGLRGAAASLSSCRQRREARAHTRHAPAPGVVLKSPHATTSGAAGLAPLAPGAAHAARAPAAARRSRS